MALQPQAVASNAPALQKGVCYHQESLETLRGANGGDAVRAAGLLSAGAAMQGRAEPRSPEAAEHSASCTLLCVSIAWAGAKP